MFAMTPITHDEIRTTKSAVLKVVDVDSLFVDVVLFAIYLPKEYKEYQDC